MFLSFNPSSLKTSFGKLTNLRPSVHVFAPQLVNMSPSQLLLLLPELLCLLSLTSIKVVKICCLFLLAEPGESKKLSKLGICLCLL